jgi:hypothetical protein
VKRDPLVGVADVCAGWRMKLVTHLTSARCRRALRN